MLKKLVVTGVLITSLLASQLQGFAWHVELLDQNDFEDGIGLPWHVVESPPAKTSFEISDGKYKIEVLEKGTNMWDIQFRHRKIQLENGVKYNVEFKVKASNNCKIYSKIGDQNEPYFEDWNYNNRSWSLMPLSANQTKELNETFTTTRTANYCEFSFYLSDSTVPAGTVFEFDDIYLKQIAPSIITPGHSPDPIHIHKNGDLNNDGEVDSTDLALLKGIILSTSNSADLSAADINKDDKINSIDLAMLKRHLLQIKLLD